MNFLNMGKTGRNTKGYAWLVTVNQYLYIFVNVNYKCNHTQFLLSCLQPWNNLKTNRIDMFQLTYEWAFVQGFIVYRFKICRSTYLFWAILCVGCPEDHIRTHVSKYWEFKYMVLVDPSKPFCGMSCWTKHLLWIRPGPLKYSLILGKSELLARELGEIYVWEGSHMQWKSLNFCGLNYQMLQVSEH